MALLAAATVFLTVVMFALSFNRGDSDPVRARVAGLSTSHTFVGDRPVPSFKERVMGPLMGGVCGQGCRYTPSDDARPAEAQAGPGRRAHNAGGFHADLRGRRWASSADSGS